MLYRGTICKDAIYVPLFKSIGTNHISCHLLVNDSVVGDDGKVLLVLRNVGDAEADGRQHLQKGAVTTAYAGWIGTLMSWS